MFIACTTSNRYQETAAQHIITVLYISVLTKNYYGPFFHLRVQSTKKQLMKQEKLFTVVAKKNSTALQNAHSYAHTWECFLNFQYYWNYYKNMQNNRVIPVSEDIFDLLFRERWFPWAWGDVTLWQVLVNEQLQLSQIVFLWGHKLPD